MFCILTHRLQDHSSDLALDQFLALVVSRPDNRLLRPIREIPSRPRLQGVADKRTRGFPGVSANEIHWVQVDNHRLLALEFIGDCLLQEIFLLLQILDFLLQWEVAQVGVLDRAIVRAVRTNHKEVLQREGIPGNPREPLRINSLQMGQDLVTENFEDEPEEGRLGDKSREPLLQG
jgi:hypothetical protein